MRVKKKPLLPEDDLKYLRQNYAHQDTKEIAAHLGLTEKEVYRLSGILRLFKSAEYKNALAKKTYTRNLAGMK